MKLVTCFHVKISVTQFSRILLIKEKFELDENFGVQDTLIPTTFEEETNFLDSETMLRSKRHYMTHYWQLRKEFLKYFDESMTYDSLIGSKICSISKKNLSYVSKISAPSILTENTEISKR